MTRTLKKLDSSNTRLHFFELCATPHVPPPMLAEVGGKRNRPKTHVALTLDYAWISFTNHAVFPKS
jgi:hypothetical protein